MGRKPRRCRPLTRQPVCDLPPDPTEVMRELQEIANTHPELADRMKRAVTLIAKQSAFTCDIINTVAGYRWPEVFE